MGQVAHWSQACQLESIWSWNLYWVVRVWWDPWQQSFHRCREQVVDVEDWLVWLLSTCFFDIWHRKGHMQMLSSGRYVANNKSCVGSHKFYQNQNVQIVMSKPEQSFMEVASIWDYQIIIQEPNVICHFQVLNLRCSWNQWFSPGVLFVSIP